MKKLFAVLIICSLSFPVLAIEEQENTDILQEQNQVESVSNQEVNNIDTSTDSTTDTLSVPSNTPTEYKTPFSKKVLIKKFFIAMLCIAGTSIFLYGALTLYNKFRDSFFNQASVSPEGETPLDAPADLTEAVKTFVDKTRWDKQG